MVILDEVQRMPELFTALRGIIDAGRRQDKGVGRFLLLGSASADLLKQSETLAGRIAYLELSAFNVLEIPEDQHSVLWVRGGFPSSFLASDERHSIIWREDFIWTYLERDIPMLGPRIPATTLRRFWTMLAHVQGCLFNAAMLARGLDVDGKTIARYLDLLTDLMLVSRLPPFHGNVGKRLVRAPKVYVRDSGVVHSLLGIADWPPRLATPRPCFTAPATVPKLICYWIFQAMVYGPLKLNAEFLRGRKKVFLSPATMSDRRIDLL